jgi:diguanylate cyclase (GGDEF)-like protein
VSLPTLPDGIPAQAFVLSELTDSVHWQPLVVFSHDSITERLIVLSEDHAGCVYAGVSGRAVPYAARSIDSPLPNSLIPAELGSTPPVAIIADSKSIRPWVEVLPEAAFRAAAARTWVSLGAYTGLLMALLLVGIGFMIWQRSTISTAYVVYIVALQFYQLQALGLGFAWVPFWPGPDQAALMQALAAALVVPSATAVVVAFLAPRKALRRIVIAGVALSSAGFLGSVWSPIGYRFGAAALAIPLLVVLSLLALRLRSADPSTRWFAAGLAATSVGGGIQALTITANGAGLPGLSGNALLFGNLAQSVCWMIALAMRFRDERERMQRELIFKIQHDPLTGLVGRARLKEAIDAAVKRLQSSPLKTSALLHLNLDRFKQINDSLGHVTGDRVLISVARTIEELRLPADAIGRFGGDDFGVLIRPGTHRSVVAGAATALVHRFREPLLVQRRKVSVSASVGVVEITADYANADAVMQDADTALQLAKRAGGGRYVLFEPFMRRDSMRRSQMRSELTDALDSAQLTVYYQPIFELDSIRVVGFEALVRWQHPEQGVLPAAAFLPTAERLGLLSRISAQVIDGALRQVWAWQRAGLWRRGEYLSLNVSPQQLADESLFDQLDAAFARYPVDPGSVRIDLPEAALSQAPDLARQALPRLIGRNLLIAIDDFGTGLSPLTLQTEFAIDMIKLDGSVVAGIASLERAQSLARIALRVADELGSLACAEGIEQPDQLSRLQAMGYRYGQGRLLAPPMPASEVVHWLGHWERERVLDAWTEAESEPLPPVLH